MFEGVKNKDGKGLTDRYGMETGQNTQGDFGKFLENGKLPY